MDIRRFGPDDSSEVAEWVALVNACRRTDAPWRSVLTTAWATAEFRHGWDGEPGTPYLQRVGGVVVGGGSISTSDYDNRHLAWFDIQVHPDHRRRGHGSALLAHLERTARALGRTSAGFGGEECVALAAFAARHGYAGPRHIDVIRRQDLRRIDWPALEAAYDEAASLASDYVLERHTVPSPDQELEAVARMTAAINDAPTGELDIEDEVYSADRIRSYEAAQLGHGFRMYRVVARHRPTGEMAGHTVVAVDAEQPTEAEQHDTAVLQAHRGHRLGLVLKTEMLRWLRDAEPQVERIDTGNAESNRHMIGVNNALGYRIVARELLYQRELDPTCRGRGWPVTPWR